MNNPSGCENNSPGGPGTSLRQASEGELATVYGDPSIIERTIAHIASQEVFERYIQNHTVAEWVELEAVTASLCTRAEKLARIIGVPLIAASLLGMAVNDAKTLGRPWNEFVSFTGKVVPEGDDSRDRTIKNHLITHIYAKEVEESPRYQTALANARTRFDLRYKDGSQAWQALIIELQQRKDDPDFLDAAYAWAESWDSQCYAGPNEECFSSGLIHFFEYRSDRKKAKRFRMIKDPMTVDGFIAFTQRAQKELDDIDKPADDPEHHKAWLIDEEGNQRFYILRSNGDFIVAFRRFGDPNPKITSITTEATARYFHDVVAASLSGEDRGRVNKLGKGVHAII